MSNPYINKSKTNYWGTPQHILDKYKGWFDPAPYPKPLWDGLNTDWLHKNKIYVNPPYNNISPWAKKCAGTLLIAQEQGVPIEMHLLIPVRTDTKYFHEYIYPYCTLKFIKGRLKFRDLTGSSDKPTSAPFPNMVCIYRNNPITSVIIQP